MTIAIAIKVHDGIVLAADSTTSIGFLPPGPATGPMQITNTYNNANKVFNLIKGQPLGGATWGSGSIGTASISTLMKDLRKRMVAGGAPEDNPWHIDLTRYTVEEVALKVKAYFEEQIAANPNQLPTGGFLLAGYSTGNGIAESWLLNINNGVVAMPVKQVGPTPSDPYMFYEGQGEAIERLVFGMAPFLPAALAAKGVPVAELPSWLDMIRQASAAGLLSSAMPIQDAIDLADFLATVSAQFSRYTPGPQTIGGPIDIAAITKHEGFKWVRRKHYYPKRLNPPQP
jgi:hypothetical protein